MSMELLNAMNGAACVCGKEHRFDAHVLTGKGVLTKLPEYIQKQSGTKAFVLSDINTYQAAGEKVCSILQQANIAYTGYTIPQERPAPDESSVGSVMMHYDAACDIIVGVGSGVINDIGKILSQTTGKPYIIVATAPSMDGYASASSSMTRDGLKISLPSRSADVIIGDTDILRQAPMHMMKSGLGDMLAKYVSICEWRISHLITNEYYCENIADLIRSAVKRCVDNAPGLINREEDAVEAVFEGLVIGGIAMNYAGLSRPASGVEHYISHILDMRAVEFGTPEDLHGIQCAIGTLIALGLYDKIRSVTPDKETACQYVANFDYDAWAAQLRTLLGKGAESMIALEKKEGKYDVSAHKKRLDIIVENWQQILQIISEELPAPQALKQLMSDMDMPTSLSDIGISEDILPAVFQATKDIRDKYVLSRLAWDLGIIENLI